MLWYIFVFPFTVLWDLFVLCIVLGVWFLILSFLFGLVKSWCASETTVSKEAPTEEMSQTVRFI